MKQLRTVVVGFCALFLAVAGVITPAFAQVPRQISYQGVLTDAVTGKPFMGKHLVTVKLYDAPLGVKPLWEEEHRIDIDNGLFNLMLGSRVPLALTFNRPYFIGVSIDGKPELTRVPLAAAPYSLQAAEAQSLAPNATGAVTSLNGQDGELALVGSNGIKVESDGGLFRVEFDPTTIKKDEGILTTPSGAAGGDLSGTYPNPIIGTGKVTTTKLADASVSTAKVIDGAITSAKIADGTIASVDIATGAVATSDLADNAVTSAKIADGTITSSDLANGSVQGAIIATDAVMTEKIRDLNVTTAKIADGAVTTVKLGNLAVTNAKLADGSVTTVKLANDAVTGDKLADNSVSSNSIINGAIQTIDIADNAIGTTKITDRNVTGKKIWTTGAAAGNVITYNGADVVWGSAVSPPLTPVCVNAFVRFGNTSGTMIGQGSLVLDDIANGVVPISAGNCLEAGTALGIALVTRNGGALQASTGGNTRGNSAVDWQMLRSSASQVASGDYSTLGGGVNNTANGGNSTVSGGYNNTASGGYSTLGGGLNNTASGGTSTLGGGYNNTASGSYSTVSGGHSNQASDYASTVSGGYFNTASGYYSTVSGGVSNTASGYISTVSGGESNQTSGNYSTVSGGRGLTLNGSNSIGFLSNNFGTRDMTVAANSIAVFGNTDLWLASNDGTTRALKLFSNNLNAAGDYPSTTAKNVAIKAPNSLSADYTLVLPPDDGANGQVLQTDGNGTLSWAASLTNFTESLHNTAPNTAVPVVRLLATNAATNVDIALSPKGTGALTAQVADNTATGGDKRGQYAVDWQMLRSSASQVASGYISTVSGGESNQASGNYSTVGGGVGNTVSGFYSTVSGGEGNQASGNNSTVGGGFNNTASGHNSTVSGGYSNTASGLFSTVSGLYNTASGNNSTVSGGRGLTLSGSNSFGFLSNDASRDMTVAAGSVAVFGNTDLWLASNDGTTRALKLFSNNLNASGAYPSTTAKNVAIKAPNSLSADYTLVLPPDDGANGQVLQTDGNGTLSWAASLTNFTESLHNTAPNTAVPVVRLLATNAATDVDIALSPKGTGALTAQVADNAATGGNKRGVYAVDWQMLRNDAVQVASGEYSTIAGGINNSAAGSMSTVGGGGYNVATGALSTVGGGSTNTAIEDAIYATISGGTSNTANQMYTTIGGGINNTANKAYSTVGGGSGNLANGDYAIIAGGGTNNAGGDYSAIGGGYFNTASGNYSVISGGRGLTLSGANSIGFLSNDASRNMTVAANSVAVFGNTDLWLASNDGTTRALKLFSNNLDAAGDYPSTTAKNVAIKAPDALSADYTLVLPPDDGANGQVLQTDGNGTLSWAASLTNFTESLHDNAPNTGVPVVRLLATNAATNVDVAISPKGNGALTAHVANDAPSGGNKRGTYAVDWQTSRAAASQVASGIASTVSGGISNRASVDFSTVSGGYTSIASGHSSTVSGGYTNTASGSISTVSGGQSNTASGNYSTVSGGVSNTASGNYSTVSGGLFSTASGYASTVSGGRGLTLSGANSIGFLSNDGTRNMTIAANSVAVFGNTDLWLASNDGTTRALKLFSNNLDAAGDYPSTTAKNVAIKAPDALVADYTLVLPPDDGANGQVLKTDGSGTLSWAASLTNFTESLHDNAPNTAVPVVRLLATNAATNVDVAISPKGNGALTAQVANDAVSGGNKRGIYAVDWQRFRFSASHVSSGDYSTTSGGYNNTASGEGSTVSGGTLNEASDFISTVSGGYNNRASGTYSTVSGGSSNTASGGFSTVSGGADNTASEFYSTVSGGRSNTASGDYSTITGGRGLTLSGASSIGFLSNSSGSRNMTIAANSVAVFGNTDLWLASNDGTTRALKLFSNNLNASGAYPSTTAKNVAIKAPDVLAADYTLVLPPDDGANGQVLKTDGSGTLSWATNGLTNFTESLHNTAPNVTVPVVLLLATNTAANVDVALSPKGNGALTAQVADNAATGGNKRGQYAVDWQMLRSSASQVASGSSSTVSGGQDNTASGTSSTVSGGFASTASGNSSTVSGGFQNTSSNAYSSVSGGSQNTASGNSSTVSGGVGNQASGVISTVSGGYANTASGNYSTVSGGYTNTASGNYSTVSGGIGLTLSGSSSFGFLSNSSGIHNMTIAANNVAVFGNTDLWLASNDGTTRALKLFSNNLDGSGDYPLTTAKNVAIKAPNSLSADYTLVLPPDDGANGQVLKTDGSGTLSWTDNGGGGVLTGIQTYAATAGGTNNFTISNTTAGFHILTYTGDAGTGTVINWTLPDPSSYSSGSVLNFLTQAENSGGVVASTSLTTPSGVIYSLVAGKGTTAFTIGSVSQFALMTNGTNWYRIR